jgi:hypothetical protein
VNNKQDIKCYSWSENKVAALIVQNCPEVITYSSEFIKKVKFSLCLQIIRGKTSMSDHKNKHPLRTNLQLRVGCCPDFQ